MVVGDIVKNNARRYPQDTAYVFEGKSFTWRQVNERVNALAHGLMAMGLGKGDRVAFLAPNSHRCAELYFALAKAGLVAIPINYMLVGKEIAHLVNDAGAKCLLVADEYVDRVVAVRDDLAGVNNFIGIGEKHGFPYDYEALVREHPSHELKVVVDENDWRSIKYTSGTTGLPKGCVVTHRQMILSITSFLIQMPHSRRDRCLMALPIPAGVGTHLTTAYSYLGCTTVILKRFDPVAVFEAIEQERITTAYLIPTMLIALANHAGASSYDLSSLRLIGYGGSPIAVPVVKQAMSTLKCDFYQTFGNGEAGGFISYLLPEDHALDGCTGEELVLKETRLASCGRESISAHIRVVDDDGRDVPAGDIGEMIVESESAASGYWSRDGHCVSLVKDGWLHTGDMVRVDEDGCIFVMDRKKDMIISGGFNVYPAEVEAVLYKNPVVKEAAVIGVPDEKWGEAVKALVVLKDGIECSEDDILEFCRANLAGYKRPKTVEFMETLPKSSLGKILKRELREKYWKGQERQVH